MLVRVCRPVACLLALLGACASHGCGPAAPAPAPPPSVVARPQSCVERLPPLSLSGRALSPSLELPVSSVVANVSLDVQAMTSRLSREFPPRVASARDLDASFAGKLSYDIDRTAFHVSLVGDRLQVDTRLTAHAELCKPLGILGCVPYGACDPAAHAVAAVPLVLHPNYAVGPANVSIAITRPCLISALSLDATPRIQSGADQQARRLRSRINAMLPSFEPGARALWTAMGVVVPLGLQSRLRIVPEAVIQGAPTMANHHVSIPLGVRGRMHIESRESEAVASPPLPAPTLEHDLQPGVALDVPVEIDLESASASVSRSIPQRPLDSHEDRLTVVALRLRSDAEGVLLIATLSCHTCGEVAFLAQPVFDNRAARIRFDNVRPLDPPTTKLASRLALVASAIQEHAAVELPIDIDSVPRGLERAVSLLRPDSGPDVVVKTEPASVSNVTATPNGLAVIVKVRGTADVVVR